MTSLATVFVDGRVDTSRFGSDIRSGMTSSSVTSGVAGAGRTTGSRFSSAFGSALKIGGALAVAFAATKGVTFLKDSITEASDLNESVNALGVTFKQNADEVGLLGEQAAESLGLSNVAFNGLAVQFSAFAQTVAGTRGDTVGVLDELTTRAADFASVMNLDVKEAAGLFQSGLAGETEPLRRYGLDLSAAAVEQEAFRTGIAETGDTLTEQQKVQARYSLLMKDTAKTQGDFRNTSDELANSQRILAAEFDNAQAKLGAAFLPVAKDVVNLLREEGIPALEDFSAWFTSDGIPALKDFGGFVQDVATDLEPVFDLVVTVGKAIGDLPGPVKEFGVEALIAFAAVSKLRTGLATMGLPAFIANMKNAQTRTAALGSAARTAAGVGGLLLLVDSAGRAEGSLKTLETVGGGALLGFAAGGPIGGAIGAGAAGLVALWTQSDNAVDHFNDAEQPVLDYAATFKKLSGAITGATRALALQGLQTHPRLLKAADQLGISMEDLVGFTLGLEGPTKRVTTQVSDLYDIIYRRQAAGKPYDDILNQLGILQNELPGLRGDFLDAKEGAHDFGKELKDIPHAVRSYLKLENYDITKAELKDLTETFPKLTNKELRIIAKVTGADDAVKDLGDVALGIDNARHTGKALNDQKIEPTVTADNDAALRAFADTFGHASLLDKFTAHPGVDAETSTATNALDFVRDLLAQIDGTIATTYVQTITTQVTRILDPFHSGGGAPISVPGNGGGGPVGPGISPSHGHGGNRGATRIELDLGEGLKLRGMMRNLARDEITGQAAHDATLSRMR